MTTQKPTFRVMKNGYDRFAVDNAIDDYALQVEQLQKKLELYREQYVQMRQQLEDYQSRYQQLLEQDRMRKEAAENIARLSLKEANEIIGTAQTNADMIIQEAIGTARNILIDLSKLYAQAGDAKSDMRKDLETLMRQLDDFSIPQMPDLRWLEETKKDI